MNTTTDLPRRLTRRQPAITLAHVRWDAPRIQTDNYCRVTGEGSDKWPGDTGSGVRCVVHPHWDAIHAEAIRVGWPLSFQRDVFVHDRNWLLKIDPKVPLLWILRECGSYICMATKDPIGRGEWAWSAPHFVARTFGDDKLRFYTWDGSRLHEHRNKETASDMIRVLASQYSESFNICRRAPITVNVYDPTVRNYRDVVPRCD